ncbi:MAG: DUF5710 domain-containing protein [Candidatus Adiutrix sp.]
MGGKTFLTVPYENKDEVKTLGAKWDKEAKLWYVPPNVELSPFLPWVPEMVPLGKAMSVMNPKEEFAKFLQEAGLIVNGLPIMDGKIHRVMVLGGKAGTFDGAYCGYADGRPNGWVQNYKTGEKNKWLANGQKLTLTEEQKNALKQETAEKLAQRERERQKDAEWAVQQASKRWEEARPLQTNKYLELKGLGDLSEVDLKQDGSGNLLIPIRNLQNELRSIQTISPIGTKFYEKGCPKAGTMHIIGTLEANPSKILVAEGYATGGSIHLATKEPVIVAFDAGNLMAVSVAIHEKYPSAHIVICADNDHQSEKNIGLEKAQEAALAVGGKVIAPEFTMNEKAQGLSDFNDLHQSRGLDSLKKSLNLEKKTEKLKKRSGRMKV